MTMEVKEVVGVIITVALASAGVFGILLVLIIDKLGGVIDSLNSIGANLRNMRNDFSEVIEYGLSVEIEDRYELDDSES